MELYSKLSNLWRELENYVKIPRCTYSGCTCGAGSKVIKMITEEKAHQFLMGLNNEPYSQIRSQILALKPFHSLEESST